MKAIRISCLPILSRAGLLLIFAALIGCAPRGVRGAATEALAPEPEPAYVSTVDLPEAKAFFHFGQARLKVVEGDLEGATESLQQAIEYDPRSAFLHTTLAEVQLQAGYDTLARQSAEQALQVNPRDYGALMLLGNLHFRRNEFIPAADFFQRAVESDPSQDKATLHLGIALARSGQEEQAVAVVKRFVEQHPDSLVGELTLARLYRDIDQSQQAEAVYRRLLKDRPDLEPGYLELGNLLEEGGDLDAAIEVYRQSLQANPDNLGVRHHIVRLLVGAQRYPEARKELESILAQNPDDLDSRRKLGLLFLEEENWPAAEETFQALLQRAPDEDQLLFYLGTAQERQEFWEPALKTFRTIKPAAELYGEAISHISYILHRQGKTAEAKALLTQQLASDPSRPEIYLFLASLEESNGEVEAALNTLNLGREAFPEEAGLAYQVGVVLERKGDREGAMAAMRQTLLLHPEHAEALNFIAYSYAEAGENLQEALDMVQRALAQGRSGHILDTLGWVYFRLGRLEEARVELEAAIALLPRDAVVWEHLGDVYQGLKLGRKAQSAYQKALEFAPDKPELLEKLQRLKRR